MKNLLISACLLLAVGAKAEKPNILFILADDQCWETLGCRGAEVATPNLDRLAANGASFNNAYNMGGWDGALCCASRSMFNTGRTLWNTFKLDRAVLSTRDAQKKNLPYEKVDTGTTWSQWLEAGGYTTYFAGKWHTKLHEAADVFNEIGTLRPGMPNQTYERYDRVFEEGNTDWTPWDKSKGGFWQGGKHWSEVLRDEGTAYLKKAAQDPKPFFAYLAFNAPHDPRQAPKEYVDRYPLEQIKLPENFLPENPYCEDIGSGRTLRDERLAPFPRTEYAIKVMRQEYYALITHLDAQIGMILDELDRTGQRDNTYIIFTADHGLAVGHHGFTGKQNLFEDSMKPPMIVVGPGIPKGTQYDERIYIQDIVPTTLELAGLPIPAQVEYQSFLPLLKGKTYHERDAIYGAYMDFQRTVIVDDYKLIYYPNISKYLLFNLAKDANEMTDLSESPEYASKLAELKTALKVEIKRYNDTQLTVHRHYNRKPSRDTNPK